MTLAVLLALLAPTPGAPAAAPPGDPALAARAAELQKLIGGGDWKAAAAVARDLERAVAVKTPLEIVDLQVLGKEPEGLGMYTQLFQGEVRGDELFVYAQVRNHAMRSIHDFHEVHLVSDLIVLDAKGAEIARDEALGESRFNARAPHRDTFVVIGLRTRGLARGAYTLRLVLHDRIGKGTASGDIGFRIP